MVIAVLALFVVVAMLCVFLSCRHDAKFYERFPPIDDDEFIRRCGAGVNRDVALRVRRIISESLGIEYERIHPDQSFVSDLDCC